MSNYESNSTGGGGGGTNVPQTYLYVDAQSGSDSTGDGTSGNPFATITKANTAVTSNSAIKPYTLLLQGLFSELNPVLLPYVSWMGFSTTTSIGAAVTLDSTWGTGSKAATIQNLQLLELDFTLPNTAPGASTISVTNCNLSHRFLFTGRPGGLDTLNIFNIFFGDVLTVTDANVNSDSCTYTSEDGTTYQLSGASSNTVWRANSDIFQGQLEILQSTGTQIEMFTTNCALESNVIADGTTASFSYDPVSYPSAGFALSNGAGAFPSSKCGLNWVPLTSITNTYTTLPTDFAINVNHGSATAITLGANFEAGQWQRIKDTSGAAGTNHITITPSSGTIDGAATYVISTNYGSVDLIYNGSNWFTYQ